MTTQVVNVHMSDYDVYIGRPSFWGNPFKIGRDGTRDAVIAKYEAWIQTQPHLLARLGELRGKRLGCHCRPAACHGDILARLADDSPIPPHDGASSIGETTMQSPTTGYKTIIAGSRDLVGVPLVEAAVRKAGFPISAVISGCARGIDRSGMQWAKAHQIPIIEMPANWDRDGRRAGYLRNERMAAKAQAVIVIVAGPTPSPGSAHMIELARRRKLPLYVYTAQIPAAQRTVPQAPPAGVTTRLDRAQAAITRYNDLYTAYWHAVQATRQPDADPEATAVALEQARDAVTAATPLLQQILARAQEAAQAAGLPWPACLAAPPAPPPDPPPPEATLPVPTLPTTVPTHTSRRTPLPALVTIAKTDPPALVQAKSRLNTQIAEAARLGKSGAWRPLKNALAAYERLVHPQPRQLLVV